MEPVNSSLHIEIKEEKLSTEVDCIYLHLSTIRRSHLAIRKWQPTPIFLPGKSHGWRSLVGYSP